MENQKQAHANKKVCRKNVQIRAKARAAFVFSLFAVVAVTGLLYDGTSSSNNVRANELEEIYVFSTETETESVETETEDINLGMVTEEENNEVMTIENILQDVLEENNLVNDKNAEDEIEDEEEEDDRPCIDLPYIITKEWAIENDYMGNERKIYNLDKYKATTTSILNVRDEPSKNGDILGTLDWNQTITYDTYEYNDDWGVIRYGDGVGFISLDYVSEDGPNYTPILVYGDKRKSYEDYHAITSTSSPHYAVSRSCSETNEKGFRVYKDRYVVACGSAFTTNIGQVFDAVLENGTIIPCVLGDCKNDLHTVNWHTLGLDGGCIEFIVDQGVIQSLTNTGDVSYVMDGWNSPVVEIRLYDHDLY